MAQGASVYKVVVAPLQDNWFDRQTALDRSGNPIMRLTSKRSPQTSCRDVGSLASRQSRFTNWTVG